MVDVQASDVAKVNASSRQSSRAPSSNRSTGKYVSNQSGRRGPVTPPARSAAQSLSRSNTITHKLPVFRQALHSASRAVRSIPSKIKIGTPPKNRSITYSKAGSRTPAFGASLRPISRPASPRTGSIKKSRAPIFRTRKSLGFLGGSVGAKLGRRGATKTPPRIGKSKVTSKGATSSKRPAGNKPHTCHTCHII